MSLTYLEHEIYRDELVCVVETPTVVSIVLDLKIVATFKTPLNNLPVGSWYAINHTEIPDVFLFSYYWRNCV